MIQANTLLNPFPGLRAFEPHEQDVFFGREEQVGELLNKLRITHFLAIIGTSGSGKTSIVNAGLLPRLKKGFIGKSGADWKIASFRPGTDPIRNLALSLAKPHVLHLEDSMEPHYPVLVEKQLRQSAVGLNEVFRTSQLGQSEGNLLIVVDQFEEVFKLKREEDNEEDQNDAVLFASLLINAIREREMPIYVVFTLRSDFIGGITEFPGLPEAINEGQYLIPRLRQEELRQAILGPLIVSAQRASSSLPYPIETRLVNLMLDEVESGIDQLPLFQHALMRTWDNWYQTTRGDRPMNVYDYSAIGTMSEALSGHIEEAYSELQTDEQRQICEALFKALTGKGKDNLEVHRPVEILDIASIANASDHEVKKVVEIFRKPGRSFLRSSTGPQLHSTSEISLSHESLMRVWKRLRIWIEEEAQSAEVYERLSEAAELHLAGKAGLWKNPELQIGLNWQKMNRPNRPWSLRYNNSWDTAIEFLEKSDTTYRADIRSKERDQISKLRRARVFGIIMGLAALLSLVFLGIASVQTIQALRANFNSQKQKANALIAKMDADEALDRAKSSERVAREALSQAESARRAAILARDSLQIREAEISNLYLEAEENLRFISLQQDSLQRKNTELDSLSRAEIEARIKAVESEAAARSLRTLALAQAVAVKATKEDDPQLKGLLARQAYAFNESIKGVKGVKYNKFDPNIYSGLYSAMSALSGNDFNSYMIETFDPKNGVVRENVHKGVVRGMMFIGEDRSLKPPRPDMMLTVSSDGKVILLDPSDNAAPPELAFEAPGKIYNAAALSTNGRWLALGGNEQEMLLVNTGRMPYGPDAGENRISLRAHNGKEIWDIVPYKHGFISTGADYTIQFCDFDKKRCDTLVVLSQQVRALAISPNEKKLAGGTSKGEIVLWDVSRLDKVLPESRIITREEKNGVSAISFGKDENLLVSGHLDGVMHVFIWDNSGELKEYMRNDHTATINQIEFNRDYSRFATSSFDRTVRLWMPGEVPSNDYLPMILSDDLPWATSLAFDRTDRFLLVGYRTGLVKRWPINLPELAGNICNKLDRPAMGKKEWARFIGESIPYDITCP